jgi:hypothetical protein
MKSMYIGSGDISSLLAGKTTQAFRKLLQRFVSDEKPYYNAKASPIDALRTGAILEDRYLLFLDNDYYSQCKAVSSEYDVLTSTLDFARYRKGEIIEFQELKTCNFDDFMKIQKENNIEYIKKNYKNNYNQVQHQLLCTGLEKATLVFLVVYEYDDEINENRDIEEDQIFKIEILRDENVMIRIKERAKFFQSIKDFYNKL